MSGTIIYVQKDNTTIPNIYFHPSDEIGEALEGLLQNEPQYTLISTDWEDTYTSIIKDEEGIKYTVEYSYVDEFTIILNNTL